jgi:hypothetical protein
VLLAEGLLIADRVARFAQLRRARCPLRGPAYLIQLPKILFFSHPRKNDPDIHVPVAFQWFKWGKLSDKFHLNLRGFGNLLARCNSAVFRQKEPYLGVFSPRTEKGDNPGISGIG